MESNKESTSWYLFDEGQKVEVSETVYKAYQSQIDKTRNRARCENRCVQPDRNRCNGDCLVCPWHVSGIIESYEGAYLERGLSLPTEDDIESVVLSKITMLSVYMKADDVVKNGATILKMRFEQNMSSRQIAEALGLSHRTIDKRIRAMLAYFRKHHKKFF